MSLEPAADPSRLYAAIGADVNPHRPFFTGDIFNEVDIPGVGKVPAIIIGHPCSIRGKNGTLAEQTPVASVEEHTEIAARLWSNGYFKMMPLAGLPLAGRFHVARLDRFGLAFTDDLRKAQRLAYLSHPGINQLQQRLVFHQTRLAVPTSQFHQAFDHTYEEADLLEEWSTELATIDTDPMSSFDSWIREGTPSRQERLKNHQERAPIRREIGQEITRRKSCVSSLAAEVR